MERSGGGGGGGVGGGEAEEGRRKEVKDKWSSNQNTITKYLLKEQ